MILYGIDNIRDLFGHKVTLYILSSSLVVSFPFIWIGFHLVLIFCRSILVSSRETQYAALDYSILENSATVANFLFYCILLIMNTKCRHFFIRKYVWETCVINQIQQLDQVYLLFQIRLRWFNDSLVRRRLILLYWILYWNFELHCNDLYLFNKH